MGKRKHPPSSESTSSYRNSVEVIMEDLSSHPRCPHGATLLFSGERGQFYACASCRDRECPVRITRQDWENPRVREKNKKFEKLAPKLDKEKSWKTFQKLSTSETSYCATCDELYAVQSNLQHSQHHIVSALSKDQLSRPSSWLPPLENDSREAQYLFSEEVVQTLLNAVRKNNIRNILCIGTPSIHEAAQHTGDMSSILLDLDIRHRLFWPPDKFGWYNMFNHHFFNGKEDQLIFAKFLKSSISGLCIVLDPPFGGRVEPIAYTLRTISAQYHKMHGTEGTEGQLLPVVWVFPYFSEPYITNLLPELQMHDYQVTYYNHTKFKTGPKKPSPVRLFTNLPHRTIDLSYNRDYKQCRPCDKWVSVANKHCTKCNGCMSKNGTTYEHCDVCRRCVKATFFHCGTCGRCCQEKGHVCGVNVQVQSCYNCSEKGHKRVDCPLLKMSKTQKEDRTRKKRRKNSK